MTDRGDDDHLPIELGPVSNGEYVPPPQSPALREAERRARELIDRQAHRRGMTRRSFLRTSMASAAVLLVLDACTSEDHRARRGGKPGGTLRIPEDATVDTDAALEAIGGDEYIVDLQTHFLDYDLSLASGNFGNGFPQARCGEADARACFTVEQYLDEMFLRSDTNLAVLSAIPAADDNGPLSNAQMDDARRLADLVCGDQRILMHGQPLPAIGNVGARLDAMSELARTYPIKSWKVYTHTPVPWFLDDHDPNLKQVGRAFLDRARETGVTIVSIHKGFGASPADLGPAAAAHPDIRFAAYHSGYESGVHEGAYNPNGAGVDRFVRTLREAGIGPSQNVYAELGSTWWSVMRDPDQAAHVLGKLLVAVGPDNVLWGSDSIWYGSPQAQIEAFRAFEITTEYQERFGYPALTPELKRKILGTNGATLYGVTPATTRCEFTRDELQQARATLPARPASYGPRTATEVYAHMADHGWTGF